MPRQSKPRKSAKSTVTTAKSGSRPNQRATENNNQAIQSLVFHEVNKDRWADLERLFEERGGPHHCWCMVWRATPEEARHTDGKSRKAALKKRVEGHVPIGILGYLGDRPVAWCSIAPRATYRRLGGIEEPGKDPERVWSLVCFLSRVNCAVKACWRVSFRRVLSMLAGEARKSSRLIRLTPTRPVIASWALGPALRRPGSGKWGEPELGVM